MSTMMEADVSATAFDAEMWACFQGVAATQVEYDEDNPNTIQGFLFEPRMLLGLHEERAEILSDDHPVRGTGLVYRRFAAVLKGAEYVAQFRNDPGGIKDITNHENEFGDAGWFLANYVDGFGINMGEAVQRYTASSLPFPTNERHPSGYPPELVWFKSTSTRLLRLGGVILRRENSQAGIDPVLRSTLTHAAGGYAVAMGILLETTFGTGFPEVMQRNYEKIEDRSARGVVLVGGGDNR